MFQRLNHRTYHMCWRMKQWATTTVDPKMHWLCFSLCIRIASWMVLEDCLRPSNDRIKYFQESIGSHRGAQFINIQQTLLIKSSLYSTPPSLGNPDYKQFHLISRIHFTYMKCTPYVTLYSLKKCKYLHSVIGQLWKTFWNHTTD